VITAKGDLIVGTGNGTFDNLPAGTTGFTLVADSSVSPTGLKWAVDPVADVVTTAGDLIYGTAADTVARLGIGTAGQVLKVNSGATAPEWGTAAGGGSLTQLGSTTTLSGVSTTVSFTATGYQNLYVQVDLVNPNGDTKIDVEPNSVNNLVDGVGVRNAVGTIVLVEGETNTVIRLVRDKLKSGDTVNSFSLLIYNVASTTEYKNFTAVSNYQDDSNRRSVEMIGGIFKSTTAISSLKFQGTGSGYSGGTVRVYGVN
jgi:hypothetical protein